MPAKYYNLLDSITNSDSLLELDHPRLIVNASITTNLNQADADDPVEYDSTSDLTHEEQDSLQTHFFDTVYIRYGVLTITAKVESGVLYVNNTKYPWDGDPANRKSRERDHHKGRIYRENIRNRNVSTNEFTTKKGIKREDGFRTTEGLLKHLKHNAVPIHHKPAEIRRANYIYTNHFIKTYKGGSKRIMDVAVRDALIEVGWRNLDFHNNSTKGPFSRM